MTYKIEKGDKFLCLENYIMDDNVISYTKGKIYKSDYDNSITDNDLDDTHRMDEQYDFFEYFKLIL